MGRQNIRSFVAALLVLTAAAAQGEDGFKIIVHPSNPTSSMAADEVSGLFLKKTKKWDHGPAVTPVDHQDSSPVRVRFSTAIHDRPVSAVEAYWQQKVFSGRGVPPPKEASDGAVIAFVQANPGAIGYVSAETSVNGCRVLEIR